MKSVTPIRDLTAAARTGLSGSWGKSIGVLLVCMLLITGVSQIPLAGGFLQLIFAAPLRRLAAALHPDAGDRFDLAGSLYVCSHHSVL